LVNETIPAPDCNWMGYDHRDNREQYRTIHVGNDDKVTSIDEKGMDIGDEAQPYIGLAGIKDYQEFWQYMEDGGGDAIRIGESYGLRKLLESKEIYAKKFTWFDTGVKVELDATRKRFEKPDDPNILEKQNEAIWFLDNCVIKYCDDPKFTSDRVKRAKLLEGFVPPVTGNTTHMYRYEYAKGDVLSKCITIPLFDKLLGFSKKFWVERDLNAEQKIEFHDQCINFYKKKTYDRVALFYKNFNKCDNAEIINGVKYPSLQSILDSIDWEYLANGLAGQFHGDYHFENILYDKETDQFKLLDWRQNFGKFLDIGDIYYDLAKLNHGLIICHELIAKDMFEASWEGNEINFDFARKDSLIKCEQHYYEWLKTNGYDVKKVKMMTAMIFLNICALHDYPYVLLLYGLGKQMMYECITDK
jgi:hypothetical protein